MVEVSCMSQRRAIDFSVISFRNWRISIILVIREKAELILPAVYQLECRITKRSNGIIEFLGFFTVVVISDISIFVG